MGVGEGDGGQEYLRAQGLQIPVFTSVWSSGSTDSVGCSLPLLRKTLKPLSRATSWRRPGLAKAPILTFRLSSQAVRQRDSEAAVLEEGWDGGRDSALKISRALGGLAYIGQSWLVEFLWLFYPAGHAT